MSIDAVISPAEGDREQSGTPTGGEIKAPAEAPKKTVNITCQQCGEEFTANSRHRRFCDECNKQRYNKYKRELYHRSEVNREKQKIRAKTQSRRRSGKIVMAAKCCIEGCGAT